MGYNLPLQLLRALTKSQIACIQVPATLPTVYII